MSEHLPVFENTILRDGALQLAREQGSDSAEARAAYDEWMNGEEAKATAAPDTDYAGLKLNIERARFDRAAGLTESAREQYKDAIGQAREQRRDDLVTLLLEEAGEF